MSKLPMNQPEAGGEYSILEDLFPNCKARVLHVVKDAK
jgi:hypothetical protein